MSNYVTKEGLKKLQEELDRRIEEAAKYAE